MEISLYWYIGSLRILTNAYTAALTTKQDARKLLFPPYLTEHIPLSQKKDDLYKENKVIKIKQLLKENGYKKMLLEKSLRELLTITACLSHNNKRKPQITKRKRSE